MQGGKRQGAGRKKGFAAHSAEEARRQLAEMVAQEIGPIGQALLAKAKAGNVAAIKELFDRAWGRAPQSLAITTTETEVVAEANAEAMQAAAKAYGEVVVQQKMQQPKQ